MKEKVSVIGIGRLGLSFALLLDSEGYDVLGCDVNEKYIDDLGHNTFVSKEPQINKMMDTTNIIFTTDVAKALKHSDLIFCFVPTPSKENGEYNHDYIDEVVSDIEKYSSIPIFKTLVIGATVMPGYCGELKKRLSPLFVDVIYNPSFIAQGSICDNLRASDVVLIGGKPPMLMCDIYKNIMTKEPNFKYLSLMGAEIAKISLNCFLTTKISFANRIGEICINSGIEREVSGVLNVIGSDQRVGNKFLKYGFGFSGVCLPRDNKALGIHAGKVGVSSTFQEIIDTTNKRHLDYLYNYFIKANPNKEVPFTFYQLSYKSGVDILTESQPLQLCLMFLENGYSVNIIESEGVIEQAKIILKQYENMVSYNDDKTGFSINIK